MKQRPENSIEPLEIDRVLHQKPGYLIRRLQQMAISIFMEETSEFDVTPIQYAALAAISVYPGIDQLRVANAVGIDQATMSGVIDRLEAKKLIVRKVSGTDRRARQLFSMLAGIKLLAAMEDSTNRVQGKILAPLSAAEQARFLRSLDCLVVSHNQSSRVPVDRALIPGVAVAKYPRHRTTK